MAIAKAKGKLPKLSENSGRNSGECTIPGNSRSAIPSNSSPYLGQPIIGR